MMIHRAILFLAAIPAFAIAAGVAVIHAVDRFIETAFRWLASTPCPAGGPDFGALRSDRPTVYDCPAAHQLRHEAGVSRRSAARHT